ncbi:hypothetical protein HanHA300_Chr08g0270301 [Helianthus annuus]|nr:hypothetical protein HanHA300_Chr08g0270301 [Helianthus annuus]KAJ0721542.1 hypothetical protein HanOQP8_Chr08g0276671 [Helianthus annuus]
MSVTKMERATAMLIYWINSFSSHKMNGYNGGGVVELEKKQQESFECKGSSCCLQSPAERDEW